MNTLEFAREIERANRRMVELRRAIKREGQTDWAESALAELSSALEELKVAEEELVSQNEELAVAQAQTEHQRHRYRELFMSSPYGQLVTDLRGNVLEANRAAAELLGTAAGNLSGKPIQLLVTLDDRDRFSRWVAVLKDASHDATVCAECGGSATFRMQTPARDRVFPAELSASPLADRFGRIDSIRWCMRDISDREQAEEAERLKDEARRKDEFLAVLGHELRNPLAAITLAAEILTAKTGDADRKRWAAEVIHRHADQLGRLVDDLLDVSRVSHGKIALQPEEVDIRHVVAAAIESSQRVLDGKRHELAVSLPEQPTMVQGDPTRLTQVVANLVDNAAKYTPSGGRIEIALRAWDGKVAIDVKDNGIGVAADMLDRIFGAYEQASGDGAQRGLGLGLALVKELVSLHGGEVRAESPGHGNGSTFTVELPAQLVGDGSSATSDGRKQSEVRAGESSHRVLVVEDNADAAEILAERLRAAGYTVELAFDGKGALAAARQGSWQVALVDLGLPDLDGFEVGRTLKAEQPGLRLIALTGYSDATSRERARQAGFERFLVKPLDARQVVSTLAELLAQLRS